MKKIIRVFPRRTKATPVDADVRIAEPPGLFDVADEVHVSVTFTWDLRAAERLAYLWAPVATVKIGGPATGERGGQFVSGMYLKTGYTITSRGCPNRCSFCSVWRRDGEVREFDIVDGHSVQDDNLLACSRGHIERVFDMLSRQRKRAEFPGGFEARRLEPWHVKALRDLRVESVFFAYDTPGALRHLREAAQLMCEGGFSRKSHDLRCYVLCGYDGDTREMAEKRLNEAVDAGFVPFAMVWHDEQGKRKPGWAEWQRLWTRPTIIMGRRRVGGPSAPGSLNQG